MKNSKDYYYCHLGYLCPIA